MPGRGKLSENDPLSYHPPHYLHELPFEDEERLEKLFTKLDKDGNGKIDIHDLSGALKEFGLHHHYAEKFLKESAKGKSGDLSLADFIHYVREHEKNLKLHFSHLDKNKDGKIDLEELIKAFNDLGIPLDRGEATNLLQRMDQDGSLNISYDEWRDFLLLAPSDDIHQLITYWRHSTINLLLEFFRPAITRLKIYTEPQMSYASNTESLLKSLKSGYADEMRKIKSVVNPKIIIVTINIPAYLSCNTSEVKSVARIIAEYDENDFFYLDIGEDMNVPDDFTQSEMQTGMWWRHLAAGGVAGAVSRTCTAPLDRLKVFLQVQPNKQKISDCFTNMVKEGGISGLWRGNGINVLKIAPESALKFAAYEQIKRLIKGDKKQPLTIYERFCAGALAGGISQTVIYPLEVLKTRLALRKTGQYKSILDAAVKIYSSEGVMSFYRGYIPNILGIIPYAGIDLAVYETLKKKYLKSHHSKEQPGFWMLLACGSASSTLGQMCSYPLALIRTRLQAQAVVPSVDVSNRTMTGVFKAIIEKEGVVGLYRGITPNFIKVMPAVSISYVVYEYCSRFLGVNMT